MMEKMITEKEAIRLLDDKMFIIKQNIYNENPLLLGGRDGGPTQKLRESNEEGGKRYCRLKEMYAENETLPESEVMKIVKDEF